MVSPITYHCSTSQITYFIIISFDFSRITPTRMAKLWSSPFQFVVFWKFSLVFCFYRENDDSVGIGEVDDRVVNVPEPEDKEERKEKDDQIRNFFARLAGEDMEVDWKELQEILDYAMKDGMSLFTHTSLSLPDHLPFNAVWVHFPTLPFREKIQEGT